GNNQQWRWEFGESGMVDSGEKSPIYAYHLPGIYQVKLSTEFTQYPVIHQIEIAPEYAGDETEEKINAVGENIREKLQAISDGKSFNTNYNYIIDTYMCGNEKTEVVINNSRYNTIYSYCQGLGMLGKGEIRIEQVLAEIPNPQTGIVKKLTVIQTDRQNRE
ncbi:MAG: PKD domain-containing protein, partial [Bacteroidales bacterium]